MKPTARGLQFVELNSSRAAQWEQLLADGGTATEMLVHVLMSRAFPLSSPVCPRTYCYLDPPRIRALKVRIAERLGAGGRLRAGGIVVESPDGSRLIVGLPG